MKLKIAPQSLDWWFWAATLIAMISGFANVPEGFVVVMLISAVQVVYFWALHGFAAFPTKCTQLICLYSDSPLRPHKDFFRSSIGGHVHGYVL